jgi:adenylate cyclase
MTDRVDALLAAVDVPADDMGLARALVTKAVELGGTDDEIIAAARLTDLGPLIIDLAMRPPGSSLSLDEFVAQSDLDPAFVRRTWSAFGLPRVGPTPLGVTPDAGDAVHAIAFLAEGFGNDVAVSLARVVGSTTAALADAMASATRIGAEVPQRESGVPYEDVIGDVADAVRELLPAFWEAVGAVFRRHLVLTGYQRWSADVGRAAVTTQTTVGFVDLVGSTEALRTQSVAELAASVDRFEQLAWDVVSSAGGRVVKLIGDEAMFVVDDPVAACEIARTLVATSPQPVRVGLAHGEIVALHGDRYGPTVNLAARLVAVAAPGSIVVSESVRDAVGGAVALERIDIPPLRGFPEVASGFTLTT